LIKVPTGVHETPPPANHLTSAITQAAEVHIQPFTTKMPQQPLTADEDLTKKFAVKLIRHFLKPDELEGRNERGVGGKQPLNPEKMLFIKDATCKYHL